MWGLFALALVIGAVFLFAPGFVALRGWRLPATLSLAAAPVVSVALVAVSGIVLGMAGASVPWFGLMGVALFAALAIGALGRVVVRKGDPLVFFFAGDAKKVDAPATFGRPLAAGRFTRMPEMRDAILLAFSVACGVAAGAVFYLGNLSSPDSFLQEIDNIQHLSEVRVFMETGVFSSLTASTYVLPLEEGYQPFGALGTFYPSAWHALCACLALATGISVPAAVNAMNFLFAFTVYPAGVFALLRQVFPDRPAAVGLGCLASVFVVVFPWNFIFFGPLYPNLAANALVPASLCFFAFSCERGLRFPQRAAGLLLTCVGVAALALSQPNSVFMLAMVAIPLLMQRAAAFAYGIPSRKSRKIAAGAAAGTVCAIALMGVWYAMYRAPFLQSVVSHSWAAPFDVLQSLLSALLLSYDVNPEIQVEAVIGLFAIVGLVVEVAYRRNLWLVGAYLFAVMAFVACASTDGGIKHFLSGFWYTDPRRMIAMVGMTAVPLAGSGMWWLAHTAASALERMRARRAQGADAKSRAHRRLPGAVGGCVAAVAAVTVLFACVLPLPGLRGGVLEAPIPAAGAIIALQSDGGNDAAQVLTADEIDFAREAAALAGEGTPMFNEPNDGSAFLFGGEGVPVVFRAMREYTGNDTGDSELVRTALDEVASRSDVREAVRRMGVEYVLVLDQGEAGDECRRYLFSYGSDDFSGIEGIRDDTPGFSVVLSRGDMRLYHIDAVASEFAA